MLEEINQVLAGADPTYDQLKDLRYCEAVFSESLRLYPSVPMDGKMAMAADWLPDGTSVPVGSWVVYNPYVMGRSERLWGKDACVFNPERWLHHGGRPIQPSPYVFPAFQAGPRTCLGRNMAYLEAKCCAAMLLQRFQFRVVDGHKVIPQTSVTLPMRYGLLMNVEARS